MDLRDVRGWGSLDRPPARWLSGDGHQLGFQVPEALRTSLAVGAFREGMEVGCEREGRFKSSRACLECPSCRGLAVLASSHKAPPVASHVRVDCSEPLARPLTPSDHPLPAEIRQACKAAIKRRASCLGEGDRRDQERAIFAGELASWVNCPRRGTTGQSWLTLGAPCPTCEHYSGIIEVERRVGGVPRRVVAVACGFGRGARLRDLSKLAGADLLPAGA